MYPDSAKDLGLGRAIVLVNVTIDPDGTVKDLSIYKSSGNMAMDREALRAARASTYAPKIVDCQAVTGQYVFRAEFDPN